MRTIIEQSILQGSTIGYINVSTVYQGNYLLKITNGNTALSSDNLYKSFDGIVKKAKASGHVVAGAGAGVSRELFNKALKALPRKYKQRRGDLRFLVGSNLIQDFLYANSIGTNQTIPSDIASGVIRGTTPGLGGPAGYVAPFAFGIPIVEVPMLKESQDGSYSGETGDHGDIHLTFPNNVVIGINDFRANRCFLH